MSTIWPFFNNSFSNANINKILNEIEQDNLKRIAKSSAATSKGSNNNLINSTKSTHNNINVIGFNGKSNDSSSKSITHNLGGMSTSNPVLATSTPSVNAVPISLPTNLLNNNNNNNNNNTNATNNSPIDSSMSIASLSPHVAYSPTTTNNQFNITASQLLQSIQNNSPSPSPSPLAKLQNSASNPTPITSATSPNKSKVPSSPTVESNTQSSVKSINVNNSPPLRSTRLFPKNNINVYLFNKLLDQPNLIDEINLSKNQKLLNYLSQKDVINTMFDYILFSMKLSKFASVTVLPNEYLSHDIFVSTQNETFNTNDDDIFENESSMSNSNFENESPINNSNFENDNLTNNRALNRKISVDNEIENDEDHESENDDENENENLDKLQLALQRAAVISEIIILPNSNIHQTLLKNFDMFTKFWRGFMNNDPKFYFKNTNLEQSESTSNLDDDTSNFDDTITIDSTDLQKLSELEESNNYINLRDSHEIILFNNFLKFVDDLASINIGGFMNFVRFEQEFNNITDQFIKFIPYSQTVCDLLVRLISTDKPYNSNGLINILIDQHLILNLLKICNQYYLDHQVQDNVCNLLNGIVGISSNIGFWEDQAPANQDEQQHEVNSNNPNIGPNDLTRQLVSEECIDEMMEIILLKGNYGLVTIVSVIIEVIRKNNSDYDEFDWISSVNFDDENKSLPSSRDPIYLGNLLKLFSLNLDKIVDTYLTDSYYKSKSIEQLNSSIGHEIEPLGYERFKIMELIAELLHCSNMILMNKSIELDKLIYKRDLLRDVKKTEQLMNDAINGLIINNENGLDNDSNDKLSIKSTNNNIPYIEILHNLSIGNFFKYKLLITHAIPLITLKLIKFPWNNFMHNVIFDLIQQIFNGRLANWDEDRAINQEETIYDDNLSLNKILIWSLFGSYDEFSNEEDLTFYKDYKCKDENYPGFFNLALFILHCYKSSNDLYLKSNFRFGYMGHLTLIAEEIHKFQSYVENFGLTKNENAFGLHKEEEDSIRPFYLKSSYYIFNELYESIFEIEGNFSSWLEFVNTDLREISSMYNKVLGNPNEIINDVDNENMDAALKGNNDENNQQHLGLSSEEVLEKMSIEETPKAQGAIILDNGDSEEFRSSPVDQTNEEVVVEE